MASIKSTDLTFPPIINRPTSFVAIRPTNKMQNILQITSKLKEITKTVFFMETDKKANA